MEIVCLDLEGVLIPEIWIGVAERTGIDALKATTRDIADYDELMGQRLRILDENGIGIDEFKAVIDEISPLEGAKEFLDWARSSYQVVILSDTFYEFAQPLMPKLGWPTLFCHHIETDSSGRISGYHLRMGEHKRKAVAAFQNLNFKVIAAGDSFNDTGMLGEADQGIFVNAPENVTQSFPQFSVVHGLGELKKLLVETSKQLRS